MTILDTFPFHSLFIFQRKVKNLSGNWQNTKTLGVLTSIRAQFLGFTLMAALPFSATSLSWARFLASSLDSGHPGLTFFPLIFRVTAHSFALAGNAWHSITKGNFETQTGRTLKINGLNTCISSVKLQRT